MLKTRFLSACLCILMLLPAVTMASCADTPQESIVILYENDVHCAVDGYSKLAAMKAEFGGSYDHVGVVSSGDFVQGGTYGAVSKGEYIINLMNKVGYDAIALGNHEFDYQIAHLLALNDLSNTKFLSCNFAKLGEDKPYFDSYTIVSYGGVDIAYIGITTPETANLSDPQQFKDGNGELLYTFGGADLYGLIQSNIDAVLKAGADYVIALSHVGYSEAEGVTDITDIIQNTEGFDVVLDAHSHTVIEEMKVKDKRGDEVLLSSTGTKFEYVGKLTVTEEGLDTELIDVATYEKTDAGVDSYLAEIYENYVEMGNRVIGESKVTLNTHEGEVRLVRNRETALGNFCSDALRVMMDADVSFVNGGGLRAPIEAGEVTFNDIFSVLPYNDQIVTAEITGQVLLDLLEKGMMKYPEESGSFPNMSGVTFSVNIAIPTSVTVDENGFFTGVDGDYRVYDVKVLDRESGEYQPLALDRTYLLAGSDFNLCSLGDGMAMFEDAKLIDAMGSLDIELVENYIADCLGGVIGEQYAAPQGRITFTEGYINE